MIDRKIEQKLRSASDRMSVQVGGELFTDIIAEIRYESPLFGSPRMSWWKKLLVWLRVEPAPISLAVLPTVTVTSEAARVDALEKTLAVCADALAAIEDMENDPA